MHRGEVLWTPGAGAADTAMGRFAAEQGFADHAALHEWSISDLDAFRADYPEWDITYDLERTLQEIHDANAEQWASA